MEKVTYPVLIRPGVRVKLTLPEDLTSQEAERLATFVRSLVPPEPPMVTITGAPEKLND
jgi:hypothetical protein